VTFLIDMNLSPEWVELLKESGIDALHWSRLGETNAPDDVLFDRARAEGWAGSVAAARIFLRLWKIYTPFLLTVGAIRIVSDLRNREL